jgi:hypothetical protein
MPSAITAYRVFIASPSGLDEERRRFREILNEFNEDQAIESGVMFIPIGWELTLAGMGRPQGLVNDDLQRCDYSVLLLHDRWGNPPSLIGPYSSGTEEEYHLVRRLITEGTMKNLVVFFKEVDESRLSEPDAQLENVRDFKRKLEAEKELLFYTYASTADFERRLHRHLAAWLKDHTNSMGMGAGAAGVQQ